MMMQPKSELSGGNHGRSFAIIFVIGALHFISALANIVF
jgi:hypothetical protein